MTYGAMQTRIADELIQDDSVGRIKSAILSAITFYESDRFWFLEGEATTPTVAAQANYATPTDLNEIDALTIADSVTRQPLRQITWPQLRNTDTTQSKPTCWAIYGDEIWLTPVPDQVYTLQMSYLLRLATLSGVDDTNAWMTHGEELIRNRAKYSLLLDRDPQRAGVILAAAEEARRNLSTKSNRKIRTGTLSFDAGLTRGRSFNINTG